MARRSSSSKVAPVSQVCETGCSSRLYRILNFREGQATKRLVSNTRHSNIHAIENGNSGKRPDVLNVVDEKHDHNHAKVSSKRRNYYGCKSISCLKNCQVAIVQGNEAINKVVARNVINGKYLCKDGAIVSQPHQFLDALQILYTNKELFLKLVQDQNSVSVKEHHLTKDGDDEARGLESVERKSDRSIHSGFPKGGKLSIDFKGREKMKIRDFMSCRGQNAVSVRESRGRNITRTSVSPSRQTIQNMHVEATKNLSETLNCRIEEQNNNEPPGAVLKTIKDELHCFDENVEKSPPDNSYPCHGIPTGSEKSIKSGYDLDHPKGIRHMDVLSASEQVSRNMDSPAQSFDVDITSEGNGSVIDSPHVVEDLISSSPEVSSSSSSSCQSVDDPMDMRNIVDDEHLSSDSTTEKVMREEIITNPPPTTVNQPDDELLIQAVNYNSEEHHSADLIRCSSDLVNNLITATDMSESDCNRELLQALSLKWDELMMKHELPDQVMEEIIGLKNQLSGSKILFDHVMEVFMETYQNLCRFPHHISMGKPNIQAYVSKRIMIHEVKEFMDLHHHLHHQRPPRTLEHLLEKDLASRRSWLNVQADIDDIAIEVQEDVIQELILEIISEKDTREV